MIIAFYPGGGGNRFYKWLQGQTAFEPNQGYDHTNPRQSFVNRYPRKETKAQLVQEPVVFTHCVNFDFITECWPDQDKIYFIFTDKNQSLKRQWALFQNKNSANRHPVGGPFSVITWHNDYYTEYPWDTKTGTVVDSNTFPDFIKMIQQELDSISCPEFDFAQRMFEQHGPTAPILDLYNQHYVK